MNKHKINWLNRSEIEENINLFNEKETSIIGNVFIKEDKYSKYFSPQYFENVYLAIASGYPHAEEFSKCGMLLNGKPYTRCSMRKLCERCSDYIGNTSIQRYFRSFHGRRFAFLTISSKEGIIFQDEDSFSGVINIWNAMRETIKSLTKEGIILGACYAEELAVTSFFKFRLNPHIHCVIHLDHGFQLKKEHILEFLGNRLQESGINIAPSIDLKEIKNEIEFSNRLKYLTKPINLSRAYQRCLINNDYDPDVIELLNHRLEDFLITWRKKSDQRKAKNQFGTMHHKSSGYIVSKSSTKKRNRKDTSGKEWKETLKALEERRKVNNEELKALMNDVSL